MPNENPGYRWSIFSPRPHASSQNNSRDIRDEFHHVIRELGPLMEQSQNINLGTWLRHPQSIPRVVSPHQQQYSHHHHHHMHHPLHHGAGTSENMTTAAPRSTPAEGRSDFVVSIEGDSGLASPAALQPHINPRENSLLGAAIDAAYVPGNNNNEPGTPDTLAAQHAETIRQSPELRAAISVIEKYMPFLLILLAKLIFDHKVGILVLFGLIITFIHANTVIKREVGKQAKRNISSLLAVIINLLTCIFFIYYVFEADKLYHSLIFLSPYQTHPPTLWDLLWVVGVTDFVLKLITIISKAIIVALPSNVVAFQKKGKYYLFIEQTSQSYRSLMPIQPWLVYLLEAYEGVGKLVGVVLCAAYVIAKGNHLINRFREWWSAFSKLLQSVTYGCAPGREQMEAAGNLCPICQDNFKHATMLHCKHIFCEECVSMWFDRERTCPMCRAQIADDPTWRDGATTFFLQLF